MNWYAERNAAIYAQYLAKVPKEALCEHYRMSLRNIDKIIRVMRRTNVHSGFSGLQEGLQRKNNSRVDTNDHEANK